MDHIIPVLQGGDWWDAGNPRASCFPCNSKRRTGGRTSHQWRTGRTFITLVVGTPGPDLSAYVKTHRQASDLVVDAAALERDVGSPAAATAARNAMLGRHAAPVSAVFAPDDHQRSTGRGPIPVRGYTDGC